MRTPSRSTPTRAAPRHSESHSSQQEAAAELVSNGVSTGSSSKVVVAPPVTVHVQENVESAVNEQRVPRLSLRETTVPSTSLVSSQVICASLTLVVDDWLRVSQDVGPSNTMSSRAEQKLEAARQLSPRRRLRVYIEIQCWTAYPCQTEGDSRRGRQTRKSSSNLRHRQRRRSPRCIGSPRLSDHRRSQTLDGLVAGSLCRALSIRGTFCRPVVLDRIVRQADRGNGVTGLDAGDAGQRSTHCVSRIAALAIPGVFAPCTLTVQRSARTAIPDAARSRRSRGRAVRALFRNLQRRLGRWLFHFSRAPTLWTAVGEVSGKLRTGCHRAKRSRCTANLAWTTTVGHPLTHVHPVPLTRLCGSINGADRQPTDR